MHSTGPSLGSRSLRLLLPLIHPGRVNFPRGPFSRPLPLSHPAMYSHAARSMPEPGHLLSKSSQRVVAISRASPLPYASPRTLLSSSTYLLPIPTEGTCVHGVETFTVRR